MTDTTENHEQQPTVFPFPFGSVFTDDSSDSSDSSAPEQGGEE